MRVLLGQILEIGTSVITIGKGKRSRPFTVELRSMSGPVDEMVRSLYNGCKESMRPIRKTLYVLVRSAFFVTLVGGMSLPCRATTWKPMNLSYRVIWINVPEGLTFLGKSGFERADFYVMRANGRRVMHITGLPGMNPDIELLPLSERYCVNGIYGVALRDGALRKVLLRLPPEGAQLQFYFEFLDDDTTAQQIMRTFHISGLNRKCAY
jgi:hypothetical protein